MMGKINTGDPRHDMHGNGFNVDPELLAHDLAILKLSARNDIAALNADQLYDAYIDLAKDFEALVFDKTRSDPTYST